MPTPSPSRSSMTAYAAPPIHNHDARPSQVHQELPAARDRRVSIACVITADASTGESRGHRHGPRVHPSRGRYGVGIEEMKRRWSGRSRSEGWRPASARSPDGRDATRRHSMLRAGLLGQRPSIGGSRRPTADLSNDLVTAHLRTIPTASAGRDFHGTLQLRFLAST
jgi:hypothetical protein